MEKISCSPITLWFGISFMFIIGLILLLGGFAKLDTLGLTGFIPSIAFLTLSAIGCFECLTMNMTIVDSGIVLGFHKIFPFSYSYPFDELKDITTKRRIVRLKHKKYFFGAERYFVRDTKRFTKNLEKTSFYSHL